MIGLIQTPPTVIPELTDESTPEVSGCEGSPHVGSTGSVGAVNQIPVNRDMPYNYDLKQLISHWFRG